MKEYQDFVSGMISVNSSDMSMLIKRLTDLENKHGRIPQLLTGGMGMAYEAGEFGDILKKIVFHNKEYTPELRDKLIKELGDVMWYVAASCEGLGISLDEVLQRNVDKLTERHGGTSFNQERANSK